MRLRCLVILLSAVFAVGTLGVPISARAADPSPDAAVATPSPAPAEPPPSQAPLVEEGARPAATPAPSVTPAPAPTTTPTPEPSPTATPAPEPPAEPAPERDPADELVDERTESSRTYDLGDGKRVTELFADPIFYQPDGADDAFVPIDPGFEPVPGADKAAVSANAPAVVTVAPAGDARGFVSLANRDGFRVSYRPRITAGSPDAAKRAAEPVVSDTVRADIAEVFPGTDARVFAHADGAGLFLVLDAPPKDAAWTFLVDLPKGATLQLDTLTGGIDVLEATGARQMVMPPPYAVDSTPDERRGSGRETFDVSYTIGRHDGTPTVTVRVNDVAWLADAVYPVYVDPTIYNEGTNSYGDAHVTSGSSQNNNYANYHRPDSPYCYEMWLGEDPSDGRFSNAFIRFNLATLAGMSIDSASLEVRPYHQYYNAPTSTRTWLRRVGGSWTESGITWNTRPGTYSTGTVTADCVEGQQCAFNIRTIARGWQDGTYPNYGVRLDEDGNNETYWKRLIASEQQTSTRPRLIVAYHTVSVADLTPDFAPALAWDFSDANGHAQTRYAVDIATDSGFTNIVAAASTAGYVASDATTYTPPTGSLTDLGVYHYRIRAGDVGGVSTWTTGSFLYDGTLRGPDENRAAVPFDLGGGISLGIAPHNGEARLSRDLFEIPSFGPAQALALSYSSRNPTNTGKFGYGWSSNLTEYLTAPTGFLVWHRADGSRIAFAGSGSTWTVVGPHDDTLTVSGSEYVITRPDQTKHVFESSGARRLKRLVDRFGKTLTISWTATTGTATDASGRSTAITLATSPDRITQVTDSAGRAWSFAYGAAGDLCRMSAGATVNLQTLASPCTTSVTSTGPDNNVMTSFAYDAGHRLTSVIRTRTRVSGSPETLTWSIGYTQIGTSGIYRASSVTDPIDASVANTFTYNVGNTVTGLLKTYSPLVRTTTTYTFDEFGLPLAIEDAGGVSLYAIDAARFEARRMDPVGGFQVMEAGLPAPIEAPDVAIDFLDGTRNPRLRTHRIDGETTIETAMTYSATNDLLATIESDNVPATRTVTRNVYDAAGHLTSVIVNCTMVGTTPPADASTCTGAGTHDEETNLATTYTYTANNQVETETDPAGRVTRYTYDQHGNQLTVTRNYVAGQSATHERNVTTTTTYTAAGQVATETDPLGHVTTYTYDLLGRQRTEILPGDATIPELTRETRYDELGNVLEDEERWTPLAGGNPVERITTHVHDRANREIAVYDPTGVATTTAYDAAGNAIGSTEAGITTTRTFDGLGQVLTETVGGATTTHVYDEFGNERSVTPPVGGATTRTYDLGGRLVTETVAGLKTTFVHDALDQQTRSTVDAATDIVTIQVYDRAGRETETTTAGSTTTTEYDAAGNAIQVTSPGAIVTTTVYDALDRPVTTIANDVATKTLDTEDITTATEYDAAGNAIAVIDPTGFVTRTLYNVRGLPVTVIANCVEAGVAARDCAGDPDPTGATNVTSTTMYDGTGAVIETVSAVATDAAATTDVAYDAAGRQSAIRDPMGTVSRTLYDSAGRQTTSVANCTNQSAPGLPTGDWRACTPSALNDGTWNATSTQTYDARGNVASTTAPNGRVTTFVYDAADRLIERIDNDVVGTPTAADQDLSTFSAYDAAGRQTAVRAPTADRATFAVTRTFYDELGRVTREVRNCTSSGTTPPGDPAWKTCTGTSPATLDADTNLTTTYAYDLRGNRIAVTEPDPSAPGGTGAGLVTTRYAYDAEDRLCRVLENATVDLETLAVPCATLITGTAASDISTTYGYDGAGNLVAMTDGAGHTTTYGFDAAGRMTWLRNAIDDSVAYGYDALGRKTSESWYGAPPYGTKITWAYDAAGRIVTRTAGAGTTTYSYDDNGNQLAAASAAGTITTAYDRLNRPLTVDVSTDPGASTTYSYSLTSPSWTDPSGSFTATLDAFDRQVALSDPIHGSSTFAMTYRADGQPGSLAAPNGNTTAYGYDDAGAEIARTTTGTGGIARAAYAWTRNQAGQILTEASTISGDPANGTVAYGYDPLGRLATYTPPTGDPVAYGWDDVPNRTSVQVGTNPAVTTSYDAANRPTADSAGGTYAHDADGRLTARPGQTLDPDDLGRLVSVYDTATQETTAYTYDALDRLLTVDDGTTVTRFRYVGRTTSVAETVNDATGSVIRSIASDWGGERLADWTGTNANQRFYGTNAHHDVTWTADDTGAVTSTIRYDPWGTTVSTSGTSLPDFRFQGSWFDTTTDLSWVVTRWYAPALGRFVSEDSLLGETSDPPSRHLYAYAEAEPVAGWDPDGRCRNAVVNGWRRMCSLRDTSDSAGSLSDLAATLVSVGATTLCVYATGFALSAICPATAIGISVASYAGSKITATGKKKWVRDWYYQSYPGIGVKIEKLWGVLVDYGRWWEDCPRNTTCTRRVVYKTAPHFEYRRIYHFSSKFPGMARQCWESYRHGDCEDLATSWHFRRWAKLGWGPVSQTIMSRRWPSYRY